ncbi:MAG: hypothetical protein WCG10_01260 [Chlamydiota bacterium]
MVALKKAKGTLSPLRRPYAYKKLRDEKLIQYIEPSFLTKNPELKKSEKNNFDLTRYPASRPTSKSCLLHLKERHRIILMCLDPPYQKFYYSEIW